MSPVTSRMHAVLTRELIAACGGLDEAAAACRLKKSRLSECQSPGADAYLPIDVVAELEAYCGKPLYSQALVDARPTAIEGGLVDEVCEATEEMAELQHLVRGLQSLDRPWTPRERTIVSAALLKLRQELAEAVAAVDRGGAP